jgi:hypothetical protein
LFLRMNTIFATQASANVAIEKAAELLSAMT